MKQNCKKKVTAAAAFLLMCPAVTSLFYAGRLSDHYYVRHGETLALSAALPITAERAAPQSQSQAERVSLRLFGIFPIKTAKIQKTDDIRLVPCGQPFGIRMLMEGIMVIGFGEITSPDGRCCPAASAGLQEGDIIRQVNGIAVTSTDQFRKIAETGDPLTLTILRGEENRTVCLTPVWDEASQCCRTGLWVRDSTAGIGTLTYYDPATGRFGGLGHPICDADTGECIPLASGEADAVTISGAVKGRAGLPGQLRGYFSAEEPLGRLERNCSCGLFGTMTAPPAAEDALPIAFKQEITLGEAVILSTVTGTEPQPYTIDIVSIDHTDDTRNMTIEVTDEALLEQTGGIVQGMSGSPILQDGRLIGAVTHVFVDDPTRGYGIFIETMYNAGAE
ncbi:MAG: SpoIVB peptidase [Ruminococcus sp.]|nr:SpoIVB peptidase [Ruminococcus sp.]